MNREQLEHEFDNICAAFWADYMAEAAQYPEQQHNEILVNMAKERADEIGIPYYILGNFVLNMN